MVPRRIAAVIAPFLACEVVRRREEIAGPLGVIVDTSGVSATSDEQERPATEPLDVVDEAARRFGVRPGQQAAEACALASRLAVRRVTPAEIEAALGAVAEMTTSLGTTAAIEGLDTVWVDVTGAAHLVGGEEVLADELAERASALGHRVRVAIADGPRIAQAVARFAKEPCTVVPVGQGASALAPLPVHALPVGVDVASFLVRVGVFSIGELARLPRASVAARLASDESSKRAASVGKLASRDEALELAQGRDPTPLVPWEAPRRLEEIVCFEEPTPSSESLLFVLRGMLGRICARLGARAEAAGRVELEIALDRSIAALRGVASSVELTVDLPAPLCAEGDLLRALKGKVERTELPAPAVALRLCIPEVVRARRVQLDLSRRRTASPDALPALLAELSSEIGADRLGVLRVADAHRPEARSELVSADSAMHEPSSRAPGRAVTTRTGEPSAESSGPEPPTRLFAAPAPLGPVVPGAVVVIGTQMYTVERMRFVQRLDGIEWWTAHPARRDYFRAWLTAPSSRAEAWLYVDRSTGDAYLQGFCE